jgi:hypothetical protein
MFIHHASRALLAFPLARNFIERSGSRWLLIAIVVADSLLAAGAWYAVGFIIGN